MLWVLVRSNLQRAFSVLFGISLLVLLLGTLYQWRTTRELDAFILLRFAIILTGILIMARAITTAPLAKDHDRCSKCGARVFETVRAEDRQRVLTCFACGTEMRERPRPESVPPA